MPSAYAIISDRLAPAWKIDGEEGVIRRCSLCGRVSPIAPSAEEAVVEHEPDCALVGALREAFLAGAEGQAEASFALAVRAKATPDDWRGKWDAIDSRRDRLAYLERYWPELLADIRADARRKRADAEDLELLRVGSSFLAVLDTATADGVPLGRAVRRVIAEEATRG